MMEERQGAVEARRKLSCVLYGYVCVEGSGWSPGVAGIRPEEDSNLQGAAEG